MFICRRNRGIIPCGHRIDKYLKQQNVIMNIESQIRPELWIAVSHSYEAENYTHAINDAMSLVTDVLRDKTGLDGDGKELVGKALGFSPGKLPRLQVNKLQTDTERNIQIGLREVLQGMYSLVRNPRSHERLNDNKNTTDTIILFIDYLLGFLGETQQSFTIQDFLNFVTDRYFVPDSEYVSELVQKIPVRKRLDTIIAIYREKTWNQSDNFRLIIDGLIKSLSDSEVDEFLAVVSDDLLYINEFSDISLILKLLPSDLWPRLDKMSRLRVENMLTQAIEGAWYQPEIDHTNDPSASWTSRIAKYYLRKMKLRSVLLKKLRHADFVQHNFIGRYMMNALEEVFINDGDISICVDAVTTCLERGNEYMKEQLTSYLTYSPSPDWLLAFKVRLAPLTDQDNPERYLPDGTPLFGKFQAKPNPEPIPQEEDDIPF